MAFDRLAIDDEDTLQKCDLDASLRAIAHPLRRQILMWLKTPELYFPEQEYGQELGVCVGQITGRCKLSKSTVSAHLNALKTADLISLFKAGAVHFYKRKEDAIQCLGTHLKSL
ncbi:MAG TPA: ArsR family transcriptional regulator [Pseudomonas sp.]|jgi:ArsR family transcriptional regulator